MNFERWFTERTSGFERFLIRGAVFLLVLLFISQSVLTIPAVRNKLSLVDRLEGRPFAPAEEDAPAGVRLPGAEESQHLELTLTGGNVGGVLEVLVNGRAVAAFSGGEPLVVYVSDGDLVEIEGEVSEQDIEILVSAVSERILSPECGKTVYYFGRPETVGWVVFKNR